jgi:hypothetical protein
VNCTAPPRVGHFHHLAHLGIGEIAPEGEIDDENVEAQEAEDRPGPDGDEEPAED